jgi:hypothetical protein
MPPSAGGELHLRPAAEEVEQMLLVGTILLLMDGVLRIIKPDVPAVAASGKLPDRPAQQGGFAARDQLQRANVTDTGLHEG